MSEFRTFSGKTVDDAMEEACRQLGAAREKLEVEILSGGSSGIFGLVGKKKAQVRARLREEVNILAEINAEETEKTSPRPSRQSRGRGGAKKTSAKPRPAPKVETAPVAPTKQPEEPDRTVDVPEPSAPVPTPEVPEVPQATQATNAVNPTPAPAATAAPSVSPETDAAAPAPADDGETREERTPGAPPQPLTPELEALVREVMEQMLDGILGQVSPLEISGTVERVNVLINDDENSGLLIGREGQTLSSIQYLVNRIVIRRHGEPVKIQINTGEYRERQDDNLRKMAIFLADKAKSLGRPQSTKPLSSYHRRIVHLALQEDENISTRSKGDGPLKRVLIIPRVAKGGESQTGQGS